MRPSKKIVFGVALLTQLGALGLQAQQGKQAPRFEVDPLWPKPLPNHWILGPAVGVAVDAQDQVYVVHINNNCSAGLQAGVNCAFVTRTETGATENPPIGECCLPAPNVLVFDAAGTLLRNWGPGQGYTWPVVNHGITVDPKRNVWIGGSGGTDSHLLRFSADGKFQAMIGTVGTAPAALARGRAAGDTTYAGASGAGRGGRGGRGGGGQPALPPNSVSRETFGGPTRVACDATECFVADGVRNHRVAVIDPNTGAIKRFWGAYGEAPSDAPQPDYDPNAQPARQFGVVSCAEPSRDGLVYVCDRTNNRIQVFRKDGTFVKEKVIAPKTKGNGSVWDVAFSADAQQRFLYVADGTNMKVRILDRQSLDELTTFGSGGRYPGQFSSVHSIATDSQGNVYTSESGQGKRVQKFLFKGVVPVTSQNSGVRPGEK